MSWKIMNIHKEILELWRFLWTYCTNVVLGRENFPLLRLLHVCYRYRPARNLQERGYILVYSVLQKYILYFAFHYGSQQKRYKTLGRFSQQESNSQRLLVFVLCLVVWFSPPFAICSESQSSSESYQNFWTSKLLDV